MLAQTHQNPIEQNPLSPFRQAEVRKKLTEAIEKLPNMERLVISLFYCEELTPKEIESVLGISEKCVLRLKADATLKLHTVIGLALGA